MHWITRRRSLLTLTAALLASCGGGGGSPDTTSPPPTPTLTSIALSPTTVTLGPGGMVQLTVTGTYSDGSTAILAPLSGEVFESSNTDAVTVNADGAATVAGNASGDATATIVATDTASSLVTSPADSTLVTVGTIAVGPPTPGSGQAASDTAQNHPSCTDIQPFYWEIGDASGALASGSSTDAGGQAVTATKRFPIASASKWIYGMYVVQLRGGVSNLTPADIEFLNFTSGYSYMGSAAQSVTCTPPDNGADSINHCLTLPSDTSGRFFNSQDPDNVGKFAYDAGHEENHAGQFQPEINDLDAADLGDAIVAGLGVSDVTLEFHQPLLAGGIYASGSDYALLLRAILRGQLTMLGALGTHSVCAWVGAGCGAARSPQFTEDWHYSIAHWVEDDPVHGDGAFSSPGAFGFDPWIESNKQYYGVISRAAAPGTGNQNGFSSALCARQLRAAWESGVQQ